MESCASFSACSAALAFASAFFQRSLAFCSLSAASPIARLSFDRLAVGAILRRREGRTMLDTPFRSATQLAGAIRRKKLGCLELLDLYLARAEKYDGKRNPSSVRDSERPRTRARAADRALGKRQAWGPL